MTNYNKSINYPLIPNSREYMFQKQYISIHSEDRNIYKYPNSSDFELELPQDYLNVQGIKISSFRFPTNLHNFASEKRNVVMTFQIKNPYNPTDNGISDRYQQAIFEGLYNNVSYYKITIQNGYYTGELMATELTNKFNSAVTNSIYKYFLSMVSDGYSEYESFISTLIQTPYTEFIIKYNNVSNKLWFGNKSSEFTISNTITLEMETEFNEIQCGRTSVPEHKRWGLPSYLGFNKCDYTSTTITEPFYEEAKFFYDMSGTWLLPNPDLTGCFGNYIEAPFIFNQNHEQYFYIELKGYNALDETSPYNFNCSSFITNDTNGIVKSAIAKIPIIYNNNQLQWYEESDLIKIFNPPAERIRKFSIKIRYHNGELVNFNNCDYSFNIELLLFRHQSQKKYDMYTPETLQMGTGN